MDPQKALEIVCDVDLDKETRKEARRALVDWIRNGGFVPIPKSQWQVINLNDIRAQARNI